MEFVRERDDLIVMRITGALDAAIMRAGLEQLLELTADFEHGRMLAIIDDFQMPTAGAIGVELMMMPRLFALVKRIDRVAVLADQEWIQNAAWLEGLLIPGLEVEAFDHDQTQAARGWLG